MNKNITVEIEEGGIIHLPKDLLSDLSIHSGEKIQLEWDRKSLKEKCVFVEERKEDEGYYCIPEYVFSNCHLPLENIQILESNGAITLLSSDRLIQSLGAEVISCLMLQEVDFEKLADDLADTMNTLYEDENVQE